MPLDLSGLDIGGLNSLFPSKPKRNALVAGFSSGIDNLQELGYNAAAAVSDAVGANTPRDWLLERAELNKREAYENGRPDLEQIEDQSLGSALPYAGYQIAKQGPQLLGALGLAALAPEAAIPAGLARFGAVAPRAIGGAGLRSGADFAARRAALEAGERFGANLVGGSAMGSAMGLGSMYGESVEAGNPSPYAAIAAAPLYGITEGLPTALLGNTLARGVFKGSLPTRVAKAAGSNAATGATSEVLQNEMEMAFNPKLTPEEIYSRRLNSAVAGGLAEGAFGSFAGLRRHPADPIELMGAKAPPAPPPQLTATESGAQGDLFGGPQVQVEPAPAAPAETYDDLKSDAVRLVGLLAEAKPADPETATAADWAQYEAVQGALQQVLDRMNVMAPADPAQRNIMSGVHEMVSGAPVELTNDELVSNQLPFIGVDRGSSMSLLDETAPDYSQDALPFEHVPVPSVEEPGKPARTRPLTPEELAYEGQTLEGEMERKPESDPRSVETLAAFRRANNGKVTQKLLQFTATFNSLRDKPAELDAFLQTADVPGPVLETALTLAEAYRQQRMNEMASTGRERAQPGFRAEAPDVGNATEMDMRAAQSAPLDAPASAPVGPTLAQQLADADAQAAYGDQRRAAQARMDILQRVLEDPETRNPLGRFRAEMRRAGITDLNLLPEEQSTLDRFADMQEAIAGSEQPLPSAPNEMDPGLVQERQTPPAPPRSGVANSPYLTNWQLQQSPSTDEDLAKLQAAKERRERRAGTTQEEAPPVEEPTGRQLTLLTPSTGRPSAEGMRRPSESAPPQNETQSAPPAAPASTAPSTPPPPPRKPRRSTVQVDVGGEKVSFDVPDADSRMRELQSEVNVLESFIACLRKK